jgi:hypothetical protein
MNDLKIQRIQQCSHCKENTLELRSWFVGPDSGKAMAKFVCNYPFCGLTFYKMTDIVLKELIVK